MYQLLNNDIVIKLLASVLTAVVGFLLKRYFEAEPKLITYLVHASAIPLKNEETQSTTTINTHSIVVRNA